MSRKLHSGMGANAPGTSPVPRHFLYAAIACSLLIATLTGVILYGEYQEQRRYWRERLIRVAEVKQLLLQNWG